MENSDDCSGEDRSKKPGYNIRTEKLSYKLSKPKGESQESNCFSVLPPLCFFKKSDQAVTPTTYILKNITCEAKAGEISAVAGPSGAGKTTLLEILAGSASPSHVTGSVLVNDHPMEPAKFRRASGYVTQNDDALFPLLTVEETLAYTARLRLCGGPGRAAARVRELLKELGLEHVAGARIGGGGGRRRRSGISGGERRRVSIGVELVHDPAVVLLDEPTSGLDSASALHVALMLKSMAEKRGKTVVLTIHQPGFRILQLFDRVLLLSNGTLIHHGSLASLERRLALAGLDLPHHVTVLEFAIEATESLSVNEDVENYSQSLSEESQASIPVSTGGGSCYQNSLAREVWILSQRFSSNVYRTRQLFTARMVQAVLVGIVLGTIFDDQTQLGFFAFSLTFLLSATTEGLPIYLRERNILMRETSRGAYRVSSYVISNTLVFVPFLSVVAILYAAPVYWLVGLRSEAGAFLYFVLVVWLVILTSNSFVAFCSAVAADFIFGTTLVAGLMGAFFLFSGYFIAERDMPRFWIAVHYLSLFKYPFECFVINEYSGGGGSKTRCLARLGRDCVLTGDEFLVEKGLRESQKWTNLGVILAFILGYRMLCFLVLWCRVHRTRL